MRRRTSIIALLIMLAGPSALSLQSRSAEAQDPATSFEAGFVAYEIGDYAEAVRLYRRAAEQGNTSAQSNLGVMYDEGLGVPQDYVEAEKWYRLAAERGIAASQFNLGMMFRYGKGIPQDYAKAVKWYLRAAEQGYADAQINLGALYGMGEGVPQDLVEAYMWFSLAAPQGIELEHIYKTLNRIRGFHFCANWLMILLRGDHHGSSLFGRFAYSCDPCG